MLSVSMAKYRVYPKLKDYIIFWGLEAYPSIEIYSKEIEERFKIWVTLG
jgi:hypothetical protein